MCIRDRSGTPSDQEEDELMRKIFLIIMVCFGLLLIAGCGNSSDDNVSDGTVSEGKIGDDVPVKRSQVAKMLALTVYDINAIENMERTIVFEDTSVNQPYDKYINAAFNAGLISGADETHFEPDTYLSLEQAVSYTHLDVYKRQKWHYLLQSLLCLQTRL